MLVSPQSKHGNQPKTWDGSVAFQPNLHQVPASTHHQTPRRWLEWHQGSSPVEIQPVVGLEISTFGDVFLPTIHGNISVILDCPEELTRNFPPLILDRCFAMWLDFAWKCRSLIFPKTGPGGQFCGSENNICLSSMLVRDAHSRK